ncbi:MAG TPA: alpha/beta hydrolase [Gemmatimonadales bacterium]|nr:alpha/beta hydrolase [Gemmatimonadales bacterium]
MSRVQAGEPLTVADRLEIAAARAIAALPRAVKRRIAGEPIRRDGLELDLDMQVLLKLEDRNPRPPLSSGSPEQARKDLRHAVRVVEGPRIGIGEVREITVAGAAGPLAARLYTPPGHEEAGTGALIVYYHGGGWVAGDLDTHDLPCRLLARASGARVLSVDYRLAPENRFPAGVDDALAAFRDAVARAAELGADPARIAVGGDSAGGHLAAVTARQALADGGATPAFQLLIYPVTDLVETTHSRLEFAEGFVLTKENMDWYEEQLIGPDGDRHDPRVSPLLGEVDPATAPALVVTAGFDPLRDEGEAYARKLREAGVHTILRRHAGYVHGFMHALILGTGPREALAEMGGAVRAALAR